jgi:eukaryotic-like serine/threonine-protein kinase
MPDAPDPVLVPGTMVGAYRVDYALGAGGMGTVYAAEEPTIGKRAAIKVLRRALADDPAIAARFEREARAVNEIGHPGIVDVFAFGRLPDGRPYLVMSLLKGRSLRDELGRCPRQTPAEAWRIARAVAEAVAAAHEAGIIHRDLKPDNVFLEQHDDAPSRPRVLDFGLAKVDDSIDGGNLAKLTQSGVPLGTPVYMAPEQWWCKPTDGRTDQYALGVVLFEMLAGRPPFASNQYVELLQQHLHEAPPSLASLGVEVPPRVERFVERSLAKDPADRFESMRAWMEAGDGAFAGVEASVGSDESDIATSETALALPHAASAHSPMPSTSAVVDAQAPSRHPELQRYRLAHVALLFVALGAAWAVGYAGYARHDPAEIVRIAGWGPLMSGFAFLLAAVGLPFIAQRRARTTRASTIGWWFTVVAMLAGAASTYAGWGLVTQGARSLPLDRRFAVWNYGMYEANAGRFMGLLLGVPLLLSLAAMAGITETTLVTRSRTVSVGARKRELLAGVLALGAACVASLLLEAPSAAYIALVGALGVSTGLLFPALHPTTAARDELERAVACMLAVVAATAFGFARIEAREATVWVEDVTRADRVLAIVDAHRERTTTMAMACIAVTIVFAIELIRIRRLRAGGQPLRPTTSAVAMAGVVGAIAIGDVLLHRDFFSTRDAMREELEAQFALFARLDPPLGQDLSPAIFAPHPVPNLQIAPNVVALSGRGLAPLAAIESEDGAINVGRDLMHALGESSRARAEAGPLEGSPDLALTVDTAVSYGDVQRVLTIARKSGARTAEVRFARAASPAVADGAPPEARYLLPRDFVAVPITLADEGFSAHTSSAFGDVAAALAREPGRIVRVAVPLRDSPP